MVAAGFAPYPEEWWHYSLVGEPYPDTYFDFPVDIGAKHGGTAMDEAMARAIEQARTTMRQDIGGPFGAAVIDGEGNIVCVASNSVLRDHDPTAHAEINAIRLAGQILSTHDLTGCWINHRPCQCVFPRSSGQCEASSAAASRKMRRSVWDAFIYRFIEGGSRTPLSSDLEYGREQCLTLFEEYAELQKTIY